MLKKGRVVYSSGGNYRVKTNSNVYDAKPIGIFRKDGIKILVGDIVDIKINNGNEINIINKLYNRKNEFTRPNISNIDFALLATSLNEPKLNDFYLDKLITIFQIKNIEPILFFTKADLGFNEKQKEIVDEYINAGFKTIIINKKITSEQKQLLNKWIKDKFSVITGQTGVGKTTLINSLTNLNLKTNQISKALGRGKHTTRHAEAFEIFPNTYLIDTPGFSSLDLSKEDLEYLPHNFFNFEKNINKCQFKDCKHLNEKDCFIKKNYSERTMKNYKKLFLSL